LLIWILDINRFIGYYRSMLVILLIFLVFFIIHSMTNLDVRKTPCYKLKKPHSWEYQGEEGSEYMVCKECRMMPGGGFDEKS